MALTSDGPAAGKMARLPLGYSRARLAASVGLDGTSWVLALLLVAADAAPPRSALLVTMGTAVVGQILAGVVSGVYMGRWRFGSFEEAGAVCKAVGMVGVLLLVGAPIGTPDLGFATILSAIPVALVAMLGPRYLRRHLHDRRTRPSAEGAIRLLVFGAGEGSAQMMDVLVRDPNSPYLPVALLDDDPGKRNLAIRGIPVLGDRHEIDAVAAISGATQLLIAIPSADAKLVRDVSDLANRAGLAVQVLPRVADLLGPTVRVEDIRPLSEVDLLGRVEVRTDLSLIAGYVTGRRVLVTGAGGSIGFELCKQLDQLAPSELILVDRDESALLAIQLMLTGRALLDDPRIVLIDLRDREAVANLFASRRPEVVFHAAALKHLPLLEQYPGEALQTNVWGTRNVLEAAARCGVGKFVNISTDKAADPASVLGFSKRVAERLTASYNDVPGTFVSVRFGNVLRSRGSVLLTFDEQIAAGGPVTVTDAGVRRFFMTVEEAVHLVVQAGAIGGDGEVLVLDMGESVRIAEIAERLIAKAARPIRILYTGLRPGEKLQEQLLGRSEVATVRDHPQIMHVDVEPLSLDLIDALSPASDPAVLKQQLAALCASPRPAMATRSTTQRVDLEVGDLPSRQSEL